MGREWGMMRASGKTVVVVGATGLVGRAVVELALADARVARVVAPTRRALPERAELVNPIVDFDALPGDAGWWAADAVVCTLGTTLKRAGSREAFRRVDFDYAVAAARLARQHGTPTGALVSSVGAEAGARTFYLRVKAETEAAWREVGFASLTILRPSLIGGVREERRPAEALAQAVMRRVGWLVPRRYRLVPAAWIAGALVEAALAAKPGNAVVESEGLAAACGLKVS